MKEIKVSFSLELDDNDLHKTPCPICGTNADFDESYKDKIIINNRKLSLYYCSNDDIWWINPRPHESFYNELYEKYFYCSPIPDQFGYAGLENDLNRRREKAILNWNDIENNINDISRINFLEIGCATGEMLSEALNRGWSNVKGVEIDPHCCKKAEQKKLSIIRGLFEKIEPIDEVFDLIFADNVIEHFLDPAFSLHRCSNMQNKGGCLVLRLPDTPSKGPTLKLIDHTYHFTRKSIDKILKMAGYQVDNIFYSGTFYGEDIVNKIDNMTVVAYKL